MSEQTRKNDDDEQEFSLNKFDLNDEDKKEIDLGDSHYAVDEQKEIIVVDYEDSKQAPSVPDSFESPQHDDTDAIKSSSDDSFFSPPRVEQASISADPNPIPISDDDFPHFEEPVQQASGNTTKTIFVVLAIVVVALLAWFSLAGGDHEQQGTHLHSQEGLQNADPMPGMQTQIASLQQRLSSMQADLIAKNQQIAELTHQLSEQARQPKSASIKQSTAKKKTTVTQRRIQPIQATTIPIHPPRSTGSWAIIIASVNSRAAANKALTRLKAKGIAADISPITVKGKAWFRIRVSGFASRAEAEIQKTYLAQRHGIKGVWLHQSK